jgi:hypothetical protein
VAGHGCDSPGHAAEQLVVSALHEKERQQDAPDEGQDAATGGAAVETSLRIRIERE